MKGFRIWLLQIFTVISCFSRPFADSVLGHVEKQLLCIPHYIACMLLTCSCTGGLYHMHSEFNKSHFMHMQITAYTQFTSLGLSQISTFKPKALQKSYS